MRDVNKAASIIKNGGIVAYPTETVWGLGCDPWNRQAVYRILNIKQRSVEKGMILIGSSEDQFAPLLDPLSSQARAKLKSTWPGPLTWLIPDPDGWTPDWIRGLFDTVAVRISAHPLAKALCEMTEHPIVSTSANVAGKAPLLTCSSVEEEFGSLLDGIVPGEIGERKTPSKIQDLSSYELVRAG